LIKNNTSYTDNQAKADILNSQFSSLFTSDDGSTLPYLGISPYPDISPVDINTSGIVRLLSDLDPSKSLGPDKIPLKLLKLLADEVFPCL